MATPPKSKQQSKTQLTLSDPVFFSKLNLSNPSANEEATKKLKGMLDDIVEIVQSQEKNAQNHGTSVNFNLNLINTLNRHIEKQLSKEIRAANDASKKTTHTDTVNNLIGEFGLISEGEALEMKEAEAERFKLYALFDQIFQLIPEMAAVAEAITVNVLSPDSFGANTFSMKVESGLNVTECKRIMTNIEVIESIYGIKKSQYDDILRSVVLGDRFTAIVDVNRELANHYEHFSQKTKTSNDRFKTLKESFVASNTIENYILDGKDLKTFDNDSIQERFELFYSKALSSPSSKESKALDASIEGFFTEAFTFNSYLDQEKFNSSEFKLNLAKAKAKAAMNSHDFAFLKEGSTNQLERSSAARKTEEAEEFKKEREDFYKKLQATKEVYLLKKLDPSKVVKLTLNGETIGFYYIDFTEEAMNRSNDISSNVAKEQNGQTYDLSSETLFSYSNIVKNSLVYSSGNKNNSKKQTLVIDRMKSLIMDHLSAKNLVDDTNLRVAIYHLIQDERFGLRKVNISFFAADTVMHLKSGGELYGRSCYASSVLMAKLYLATLLSTIMRKISKGIDQRIFYVESAIDNDIEGAVMQTIKDIKQKNFSVSQLGDLNSTLRTISAFSDMVIPVINGQKPIEFDILAGMDANVNDDFLEYLLKSMLAGTGVPNAYIGVQEEIEFAKSLSMVNGNFIKHIVRRQLDYSDAYLSLYTGLYHRHFPENKTDTFFLKAAFAPPTTLNMTNTLAIMGDAKNYADSVVENVDLSFIKDDQEKDAIKQKFKMKIMRQTLPHVDWLLMDELLKDALIEMKEDKLKLQANEPDTTTAALNIGGGSDPTAGGSDSDPAGGDDDMTPPSF
jgi:hypothetical protein